MMRTGSVLVLSPDPSMRMAVVAIIEGISTMRVKSYVSTASVLAELCTVTKAPDLAVIELDLADEGACQDGYDLCLKLSRADSGSAVMLLCRDGDGQHVVRGLAAGARDVVRLPFRTAELGARIRVLARSQMRQSQATFEIGEYVLKGSDGLLYCRDFSRSVPLTDKEANIIRYLYQAEGSVVSKFDLLENVWNYSPHTDTHTLETHMYRLRLKFDALVPNMQPIETVGGGYRIGPAPAEDATPPRYRMRWPRRAGDVRAELTSMEMASVAGGTTGSGMPAWSGAAAQATTAAMALSAERGAAD